jgi:hypothetical protein
MVQYVCDKCNKIFTKKYSYTKHLARKNSCDKQVGSTLDEVNICKLCTKQFKSYSALHKHVKNSCEKDMGLLHDNRKIITNNDNRTINNNNMKVDGDVKLVKFGNENLSYISDDIFKSILGRGFKSVEELVDHSHFHPDHPENHNIYIANIKNDYVVIYDGKKWNINKKEDVFEDIIYAKSDFLCMKFKELITQMTETDIKKFTNFINQRDEDKTMNKIKGELKLQLYNNRGLPQKLKKQIEDNEREMSKSLKDKKSRKHDNNKLKEAMELMEDLDDHKIGKLCDILNSLKHMA